MKYEEQAMMATCERLAMARRGYLLVESIREQRAMIRARPHANLEVEPDKDIVYGAPNEEHAS
jgi:hypothetical protein